MILVTLGTQKQQFTRLLDKLENSKTKEKIIVQAGFTKYNSKKMEIFDFIDYDKMNKYLDEADLIITHAGTGSIVSALSKGKKVIACARLKEYDEHVDNHQQEIVELFKDKKYILELNDEIDIDELIKKAKEMEVKPYKSNKEKFIKELKKYIES